MYYISVQIKTEDVDMIRTPAGDRRCAGERSKMLNPWCPCSIPGPVRKHVIFIYTKNVEASWTGNMHRKSGSKGPPRFAHLEDQAPSRKYL